MSDTHGRRMASVAGGTLASRLTGLIRVLVLAWVLGFTPLADSFNLANTIPNMLFDLVAGGILSATFIPVAIERLARDGERRAWRSISSMVTASLVVLLLASVIAWFASPGIIHGFTFLQQPGSGAARLALHHQEDIAIRLLRWFVPQVFFYGVIGLAGALLNVRNRFGSPAWSPVANNVIAVAVLVWFHLVDSHPTVASVTSGSELAWLGAGTSAGVLVQFLVMLPSLARASLSRLRLQLDLRDPALRAMGRLGWWTFLVVLTNQASLYVVLALAFATGGSGPVSAYTYGWSFMQMPFAVVVVSVMSVITPRLAEHAARDDDQAFTHQLATGLRQSLVIILPASVGLIVLAQPLVAVLLNHASATAALPAGNVLAILAAGLPGFTVFQLCVRALQSLQHARDVFFLYVIENAANVILALWWGHRSLSGLTASVSVAYLLAAILSLVTLRWRGVRVESAVLSTHARRSLVASLLMGVIAAAVYAGPSWTHGPLLVLRLLLAGGCGLMTYVVAVDIGRRRASTKTFVGD